ncbi:MAG: nucleoside hydrolase [Bacteroidales bacterium]|nr:nucleoside hydrolase [Bacteroidales bacterium]MCF8389533.1 nucleoside hydrolase [Bacteroidales bacterium]
MFKNLKRSVKRAIIFLLVIGIISTIVITATNLFGDKLIRSKTIKVLIDSDSGNEIDDLFAITRALIAPELEVVGLTSAHWEFHPEAGDSSLEVSQYLNEKLLRLSNKSDIPHPRGSSGMLRYWSDPVPNPSKAAEFMIAKAKEMPGRTKLNIVTLGAVTNVASAILMDPEIIPKIRVYSMALHYDTKTRVWNKNEFNVRNDLDAMDVLLNTEGLEMHIMTATTSKNYVFTLEETRKSFYGKGQVWEFLLEKWEEKFPDHQTWIMWDVALIEAILNPDFVKSEQILTPPENLQRTVNVYTAINKEMMLADFWAVALKEMRRSDRK